MKQSRIRAILQNLIEWPVVFWVLTGFLCAYFLFFIWPIFLNPDHTMKFFVYVPARELIGQDLNYMLSYCASWFVDHNTPYIGHNLYPPFAMVIFSPLLLLDPSTAYGVITAIILLCFIFVTFVIPTLLSSQKNTVSTALLLLVTGLFSYGLHFELEKGQFNVIAFAFCMLAIYLYHHKPKMRWLAYILLTISIQLKVYPAIFIFMFVDDWTDWKGIFKRFAALGSLNIALLFVLGYQVFFDFFRAIKGQALYPYIVMNNLSIRAFTDLLFRKNGFRAYFLDMGMDIEQLHSLARYGWVLQVALLGFVAICLFLVISKMYKQKRVGLNPYLLLVCTIAALMIPPVSHDYKLSLLAGPMAIVLQGDVISRKSLGVRFVSILLILIGSLAYSITLFSYTNKPYFLRNNLPMLVVLLAVVVVMAMLMNGAPDEELSPVEPDAL